MNNLAVLPLIEADRQRWNAFVAKSSSFALMQSYEWGEFKEYLGWKAIRVAAIREGEMIAGAQMLIRSLPLHWASIAYVPRGPLVDWADQVVSSALLEVLHQEARRHRAIFLKIEPPLLDDPMIRQILQRYQFKASPYTNQPCTTITLDLTQSLDDILKHMRKKTRQYIKSAIRKGVHVRVGGREDLSAFYDLMQITAQRGGFSSRVREYYEYEWETCAQADRAVLLKAYYQDRLLAVRTVFYFGNHAAEFHAGSTDDDDHLHPNYLLVWEAIKWAKAQGGSTYDLWGIPDEVGQAIYEGKAPPFSTSTDSLWGVYQFKRGFSKNIVHYVGAYDYVYSPLLYALITHKFFNSDRLDRIATWIDSIRPT